MEENQPLQEFVKKRILFKQRLKPFSETIKYLSKDQISALLESIDDVRDRALIRMLYSSGCRVGELVKAFVDDLDFTESMWRIPAANTKSKKARMPRLHPAVINDLRSYMKAKGITKGRIFPIGIRNVQRIIRKYGDRAGIEKLHPHTLRHSHIVHSLMEGVPMSAVQKQVGHVDLRTTQIYSNLAVADVKEAYKDVKF